MWYGLGSSAYLDRIRIIYPNGKAEFVFNNRADISYFITPCWSHGVVKKPKDLVAAMRKYDKMCCRKTLFLGNL